MRESPLRPQSGVKPTGSCWWSRGCSSMLSLPRVGVSSLVWELGFYKTQSIAPKPQLTNQPESKATGIRNTKGRGRKQLSLLRGSCFPWTQAGQDGLTGPGVGRPIFLQVQAPSCLPTPAPLKQPLPKLISTHLAAQNLASVLSHILWSEAQQAWLVPPF